MPLGGSGLAEGRSHTEDQVTGQCDGDHQDLGAGRGMSIPGAV